jgi:hypothetical protein
MFAAYLQISIRSKLSRYPDGIVQVVPISSFTQEGMAEFGIIDPEIVRAIIEIRNMKAAISEASFVTADHTVDIKLITS